MKNVSPVGKRAILENIAFQEFEEAWAEVIADLTETRRAFAETLVSTDALIAKYSMKG
jgi:hypothetical protein